MTQRIFDIENADDMALLWSILPDGITEIEAGCGDIILTSKDGWKQNIRDTILVRFHGCQKITRPISEATEADIGKICAFWEDGNTSVVYAELVDIAKHECYKYQAGHESNRYEHCRRLTKTEIKELC